LRAFACLEGNEPILADEVARLRPAVEVVETRPGVLIVCDPGLDPAVAIGDALEPVFARAELTVWGEVRSRSPARAAAEVSVAVADALAPGGDPPALHVWAQAAVDRDARMREAKAIERALRARLGGRVKSKIAAAVGEEVIDVVDAHAGAYLFGAHRRTARMSAFPGGIRRLAARAEAPSRAHLKLEEGLEWAELPLRAGDVAVDVGSAPGGWSWVLLERGLRVHGVDPTPVVPSLLDNSRFTLHQGPIRTFRPERIGPVQWLFCDMNGPPLAALGQLDRLVPRFRGLRAVFHTVKLSDERPLAVLDEVRGRFRALGFADVRVRHLYHNRAELTLVARR
jgi:23S rRNA (cytidine2498-2'-O)-methyltransferase